jgi:tetratricopeptide (TPR) repeat protein
MRLAAAFAVAAACAAGTIQFAADGAYGGAAVHDSLPYAIVARVGAGPARALGIAPHGLSGDATAVSAGVDRLDARGDDRDALEMQRGLVAHLQAEGANPEVLAESLWRLGQLDAEVGYREPARRRSQWRQALDDYERALDLIPLSETTLLAAGNQALLNGERSQAVEFFRRALASDPSSAAARDGLHRAQTGENVPPPFVAPAEWRSRNS